MLLLPFGPHRKGRKEGRDDYKVTQNKKVQREREGKGIRANDEFVPQILISNDKVNYINPNNINKFKNIPEKHYIYETMGKDP